LSIEAQAYERLRSYGFPGSYETVKKYRRGRKSLKEGTEAPLEASYWHLPETPSHDVHQKILDSGR
jgi:hypothetical protein